MASSSGEAPLQGRVQYDEDVVKIDDKRGNATAGLKPNNPAVGNYSEKLPPIESWQQCHPISQILNPDVDPASNDNSYVGANLFMKKANNH